MFLSQPVAMASHLGTSYLGNWPAGAFNIPGQGAVPATSGKRYYSWPYRRVVRG